MEVVSGIVHSSRCFSFVFEFLIGAAHDRTWPAMSDSSWLLSFKLHSYNRILKGREIESGIQRTFHFQKL